MSYTGSIMIMMGSCLLIDLFHTSSTSQNPTTQQSIDGIRMILSLSST